MGLEAIFSLLSRFSATEEWLVAQFKSAFESADVRNNTELSARAAAPVGEASSGEPVVGCYLEQRLVREIPEERLEKIVQSDNVPRVGCYFEVRKQIHRLPAEPVKIETSESSRSSVVGCYIQIQRVGCYEHIPSLSPLPREELLQQVLESAKAPEVGCYIMRVETPRVPASE